MRCSSINAVVDVSITSRFSTCVIRQLLLATQYFARAFAYTFDLAGNDACAGPHPTIYNEVLGKIFKNIKNKVRNNG